MEIFANMTQRDKMLLGVLAGLLFVFGSYFFIVKPKVSELVELRAEYQTEVEAYEKDKNQLRRLQELERRFELTEIELIKIKKALPERFELASLTVELANIFEDSGVEITALAPKEIQQEGDLMVQTVDVSVTIPSSMYRLLSVIRRVENSSRYMKVISVDTSASEAKDDSGSGQQSSGDSGSSTPAMSLDTKISVKMFATDEEVASEKSSKGGK